MDKSKVAIALILFIVFVNFGLLIVISAFAPPTRSVSVFDTLKDVGQSHSPLPATSTPATNRFEALRQNLDVEMATAAGQGRTEIFVQAGRALEAREALWSTVDKAAWAAAITSIFFGLYAAAAVARK